MLNKDKIEVTVEMVQEAADSMVKALRSSGKIKAWFFLDQEGWHPEHFTHLFEIIGEEYEYPITYSRVVIGKRAEVTVEEYGYKEVFTKSTEFIHKTGVIYEGSNAAVMV